MDAADLERIAAVIYFERVVAIAAFDLEPCGVHHHARSI